jgi:hypothetical protein
MTADITADQRTNLTRNVFNHLIIRNENKKRCRTNITKHGDVQGYILLAVQAHVPSLHPPPCVAGQQATTTCESVHGSNLSLLLLGLYLIPIGDGVSTGGFVGLVFIVWVENSKGWYLGFVVCALFVILGMLIWIAGLPFYRNQLPTGSPITRILQVCSIDQTIYMLT